MSTPTIEGSEGFVVWIEGLSGAGKTTISRALAPRLRSIGWKSEVLDGDEMRRMFSPDLGFSRKDREFHARRVSYVAHLLARNGVAVIVAMITPYETSRQAARSEVAGKFVEVWLRCPIEVCRQRDPRGIYRRSAEGAVKKMTGVDDPFEEPLNPELVIDTSALAVDASVNRLVEYLSTHGVIRGAAQGAPRLPGAS
jgi:adenylylsulfate kinase